MKADRLFTGFACAILSLSALINLFPSLSIYVHAQSMSDTEFKKALSAGLHKCYSSGKIGKALQATEYQDGSSVIQNDEDNYVWLPSGYVDDDKISCQALLSGVSGFSGLYNLAGVTPPSVDSSRSRSSLDLSQVSSFLGKLGYTESGNSGSGEKCVNFKTSYKEFYPSSNQETSGEQESQYICFSLDSYNKLVSTPARINEALGGSSQNLEISPSASKIKFKNGNGKTADASYAVGDSWDSIKAKIAEALGSIYNSTEGCSFKHHIIMNMDATYCIVKNGNSLINNETLADVATATYKITDKEEAYKTANSNLLGGISEAFSDSETAVLYQNYLKNYFGASWKCGLEEGSEDYSLAQGQGYTTLVRVYDNGTFKTCHTKLGTDKTANGLASDKTLGAEINQQGVIDALNALTINSLEGDEAARITNGTVNETTNNSSSGSGETTVADVTCSKQASGLGWVLCSAGDLIANALKAMYEQFIEPALQIRSVLLAREDSEGNQMGTYLVWGTFRDLANICFVVYLLVIIFSQLTGVGIDNYGIKKTLPRLIVAAILINLSYLICQLAVDFSNILGASLYQFLRNIEIPGYSEFLSGVSAANVSSPEFKPWWFIFAMAFIGGAIWSFPAVVSLVGAATFAIVPIISGLIGAGVSVLFMFAMLSFRNAVIVLGVALSPLAFVCYMLPNTKNIFDRWFQIMKGMLLLYPICAAVIGGGFLASRIILASGGANADLFIMISALIAEVAPYFAIPSLVRAAYKATGELGARLNGMSIMSSRRAQMGFRRGPGEAINQRFAGFRARTTKASIIMRRHGIAGTPLGRLPSTPGQNRRLAEANETLRAQAKARDAIEAGADEENFQAQLTQDHIAAQTQLAKNREYARQLGLSNNAPTNQIQVNGANITADSLREATIQQAVINQEGQLANLSSWGDNTYQQGKRNQNELNVRGDRSGAGLLADGDYINMRQAQQDAAISNETTKMYVDQLSRQSKTDWETAFRDAASGNVTSNREERLRASIQVMSANGASDAIMANLNKTDTASGQTYGELLATAMRGNSQLRNDIISSLSATKSANLSNYAKHIGAAGDAALSYEKYMDNSKATSAELQNLATAGLGAYNTATNTFTSTSKYTSITETINSKGRNAFDSMDKDDLEDYFRNASTSDINKVNSEAYMRALTTKTDEEIAKLDKGLESLYNNKKADIRSKANGQFITDAKDSSLDQLRTMQTSSGPQLIDREVAYENPIRQVKSNPQMLTHWSAQRQSDYNFSSVI